MPHIHLTDVLFTYFTVSCADRQANVGSNDHRQSRRQLNAEATAERKKKTAINMGMRKGQRELDGVYEKFQSS